MPKVFAKGDQNAQMFVRNMSNFLTAFLRVRAHLYMCCRLCLCMSVCVFVSAGVCECVCVYLCSERDLLCDGDLLCVLCNGGVSRSHISRCSKQQAMSRDKRSSLRSPSCFGSQRCGVHRCLFFLSSFSSFFLLFFLCFFLPLIRSRLMGRNERVCACMCRWTMARSSRSVWTTGACLLRTSSSQCSNTGRRSRYERREK